ncbi:hypothetical protein, variant 3 [Verruconis gallopava]|uniref:Protein transport protein sec16 n=1 Tax=Verruconis gallopava TaxID=253628 RepID=A0A0D1ZXZ9_9PEZI|nr:uncharacterized protein PV09_09294 [Verruconis gallopava]XP_016208830.1 hypothetical protein, variant 1 [Verruconis gallopava]XP_016208831.1 hypothetical protein, variant 2 [Verruconis gallopava]XP_016208832.1 hypothetical protein, variant 3 [Verruconis gallopava]KIV98959.1 hypothetical protein PV09_09294 [Verruconis gallopava]KIV98960.1 hypothetical protein, variant 1 [Verruconis gallopava]KIV98961.1 hypothetical protein, variant 2 [Verruconis gallopava]KIV98962.1 hypothetical protein, v
MTSEDDTLNFSYAFGDAPSWNPALRPDLESPQKSAIDYPQVDHPVDAHEKEDDELVNAGPTQGMHSLPSQAQLKGDPSPSYDDFNQHGQMEPSPVEPIQANAAAEETHNTGSADSTEVADGSWDDATADTLINGIRLEPIHAIAGKHAPKSEHEIADQPATLQQHTYELKNDPSGIMEALPDSSKENVMAEETLTEEVWGGSEEWQIETQRDLQPIGPSAIEHTFNFDAEDIQITQLEAKGRKQQAASADVFCTQENTLPLREAYSSASIGHAVAVAANSRQDGLKAEFETTTVPHTTKESSEDECVVTGDEAKAFDLETKEKLITDMPSVTAKSEAKAMTDDDVADPWADVAEDNDFLIEDPVAAFNFDVNDGESFLDDGVTERAPIAPIKNRHVRASSVSKYTPANVPQSGLPPPSRTTSYRPDAPSLVDLSKSQQESVSIPRVSTSSPYTSAYQGPRTQGPPVAAAESFADKAKGGYHSPYDLPDDLTIRRKRPVVHHTQSSTQPVLHNAPPTKLSGMLSMPFRGPPKQHSAMGPSLYTDSPIPARGQFRAASAAQPTRSVSHNEDFSADLQVAQRALPQVTPSKAYSQLPGVQMVPPLLGPPATFRASPASYSPLQSSLERPLPVDQFTHGQLQPAEKIPLYTENSQPLPRATTVAPPASSRYSPAAPPVSKSSYYPAAPPTPAGACGSHYSPASGGRHDLNATPRESSDAPLVLPRAQAPFYAPRNSSPLAYHSRPLQDQFIVASPQSDAQSSAAGKSNLSRMGSIVSMSALETVDENVEPTRSTRNQPDASRHTPRPSSHNSTPPPRSQSSSILSSPRKRAQYIPANYQPLTVSSDQPIMQPKRPQTSSPTAPMKLSNLRGVNLDRPAFSTPSGSLIHASLANPLNRMQSSLGGPSYHEMNNLMQPSDDCAHDPLQRWKGAPIFHWGNGNSIVSTFPRYAPMYDTGSSGLVVKPTPGEIKIGIVNTVCPQSDIFLKFPGPLKKGKKKELVAWLKASINQIEAEHKMASMNGELTTAMHKRSEERILLWRIMNLLVEHDGTLEGTPAVEAAVRALLTPSLHDTVPAADDLDACRTNMQPEAFDPQAVKTMRLHLYAGEREKAVWHAVDQRLWAHALLIASTLNEKEIWKQVVQEFVRKEVRRIGKNTEALAALYQVFAGNWEESIDELVSVSARSGFQMVSTTSGSSHQKDVLAGLDKWRETLLLVLNNRSTGDAAALTSLGNLLNGYGRIEAGHICYLFARANARFGGADDQHSHFSLIGGHAFQQGSDFGHSLDTILLSETYEFAMMSNSAPTLPMPHLQPYKLYHAEVLAEAGKRMEAQQYCDTIMNIVTTKANRSAYYNPQFMRWLDDFARRLSQAPAGKSESSWKPSIDKVSSSIWGKFNDFIAGDSDTSESTNLACGIPDSFTPIPMQIPSQMPLNGRSISGSNVYSSHQPNEYANWNPAINPSFRYAPGNNTFTPRSSSEQQRLKNTPQSQSAYELKASMDSSKGSYEPHSSTEFQMFSPLRTGAFSSSNFAGSQHTPLGQQNIHTPGTSASEGLSMQAGSPYVSFPQQQSLPETCTQSPSYLPTLPIEQQHFMNGFGADPTEEPAATSDEQTQHSFQPEGSSYGYQPPSSTYEPNEPDDGPGADQEEQDTKPKKNYFMDDDDDDIMVRAAALKSQKSEADRQADEAFRKAAEDDAAKVAAEKRSSGSRGFWFGGWFSRKQDSNAPVVYKAKLGEESSFYFDKQLGRWVNKKAGTDVSTSMAATPPPPKVAGPPSRPASSMMASRPAQTPAKSASPVGMVSGPPSFEGAQPQPSASVQPPQAGPVAALVGGPPSRPSSRPSTSLSNASDIDDLLGPAAPRKAGAKKAGARKGRYVDVMADKS